mmetsp:Transcript_15694/g.21518  ORF Transcript_15694/g.21518 Transcript_15694/m.21518 type:complete len:131 (-) Transcript_15694:640-1032(-)
MLFVFFVYHSYSLSDEREVNNNFLHRLPREFLMYRSSADEYPKLPLLPPLISSLLCISEKMSSNLPLIFHVHKPLLQIVFHEGNRSSSEENEELDDSPEDESDNSASCRYSAFSLSVSRLAIALAFLKLH